MYYQQNHTKGFISNFIKCYWQFENYEVESCYEILPDGYFDLIIEIKNQKIQRSYLTGVWTKPIKVNIPKGITLIGIRFKLIAAEYIFKQSLKDLLNRRTEFPVSILGLNSYKRLEFEKFKSTFSQNMLYTLKNLKEIDNRKFELFKILYEKNGEISVNKISEKVFWSSRQINRYFRTHFGFPLKMFCDILKCHSSFNQIKNGQLFPAIDYCDQSHFIRQLKKYTGVTPKELYRNENDRFIQLLTISKV